MKGFLDTIPTRSTSPPASTARRRARCSGAIIFPLAAPVLAVVGLLNYIATINEFIIASTLLQTTDKYTLSVGLFALHHKTVRGAVGAVLRGRRARSDPRRHPLLLPPALHRPRPHARARSRDELRCVSARSRPHHDGSELYVLEPPDELGDEATVRLRVPRATRRRTTSRFATCATASRTSASAEIDEETETDVWWRASFPVWNPATPYRWLLSGGDARLRLGERARPPAVRRARRGRLRRDARPRRARTGTSSPSSTRSSRTASRRHGPASTRPTGRSARDWDEPPTGRGPTTPCELVRRRPRRPRAAPRPHRARSGANVALPDADLPGAEHAPLRRDELRPTSTRCSAATRRSRRSPAPRTSAGMRVLGDLTTNHVGDRQPWFVAARDGPARRSGSSSTSTTAPARLRELVRGPLAAEARLPLAGAAPTDLRATLVVVAAGSSRRTRSTAGGSTSRT